MRHTAANTDSGLTGAGIVNVPVPDSILDLRICRADLWALNFGRDTHEIEAMIEIVRAEREAEAA